MKRLVLLVLGGVAAVLLLSACDLSPLQTITVTTTADGRDAVPGDGSCEVTAGANDCSLRAAIDEANAAPVRTRVLLAPSTTYLLTLVGSDDTNAAGDLDIAPVSGSMTIEAPAPGATIDAGSASTALDIRSGANLDHRVGVTSASSAGIVVRSGAILAADRVSVHGNEGAGVRIATGGGLDLDASTVSTNGGPGVTNAGTATLRSSTVTRNHGGLTGSAATLTASIVGDQSSGVDCATPATSLGANLDSDGSCALVGPGDASSVDPQLGPLAGAGPAHVPDAGSPAIDAVPYGTATCTVGSADAVDQRGTARPNGLGCDRGAIEVVRPVFTVDHAADNIDAAPGNGMCADSSGRCTMRAAIQEANARPGADAIVLGDVDPVLSRAGANEDAGATGDLDITDDLLLVGRGRTVHAAGLDRVIDLHGDRVTIDGLVLVGGAVDYGGGGLRSDGGSTVLQASTVRGNVAVDYGGGIAHRSGALVVDRTWVEGNVVTNRSAASVPIGGGGLHVGVGDVTVIRSSFTGNSAAWGGGILNQGAPGQHNQLDVTASTIVGNDGAGIHGGVVHAPGVDATHIARVTASTIVDNAGPALQEQVSGGCHPFLPICNYTYGGGVSARGSILQGQAFQTTSGAACEAVSWVAGRGSLGHNVSSGGCGTSQPTDLVITGGLGLGPLLGEGGAPPVRRPFATSPVLDHIPSGTVALCDGSVPDQTVAARPAGSGCDAGAIEGSNGVTPTPLALVVDAPDDIHDALPADGICATASGSCTLRAAVDEANAWPGTDAISIEAGVNPELSLDDENRLWNGSGTLLIVEPLVLDGGGATVDANQIDRVITVANGFIDPVTLRNIRITGGANGGVGGGISGHELVLDGVIVEGNEGSNQGAGGIYATHLVATDSVIRGNRADGPGGGIWAIRADLDRVVVQGNESSARGGGIYFWIAGTIKDSLIDGNRAAEGGGFATADPTGGSYTVDITGSTFANNSATTGGGLFVADAGRTVHVAFSTIASNTATTGAAIASVGGTTLVGQSTLAGNVASNTGGVIGGGSGSVTFQGSIVSSAGVDCAPGTTVISGGYNVGADASCPLAAGTDLPSVDPLLGPLADNGGPTPTRLPFLGSPVLDRIPAGSSGLCDATTTSDQRGVPRPSGTSCDVGSVEGSAAIAVEPLALVVDDAGDVHDADPGDGLCATAAARCTLRAAIDQTNALPGEDEITIGPGIDPVLSIAGRDEGSNATGDLDIRDAVVIRGGGATISAAGLDRVFDIAAPTRLERLSVLGGDTGTSATPDGGNILASADLELENVTVTLGSTRGRGAGLAVAGGTTSVVASTFSLGSADTTARAISVATVGAQATLAGSVVDGPLPLCAGPVTSLGRNVAGDATCGAGPTDIVGASLIGPLRAIGGFDVHLPYTSSPAIDAVPAGTPGLCDGSVATDERGDVRPAGGACDAGATEGSVGFAVPAAATITVTSSADAVDTNPGDGACVATGGGCTLRAAIDEANARPGPDTVAFDSPRTVALTRAGAREAGNRTGDLDVVGDLTLLGGGSVVDANNLDRVIHQRTGVLRAEQITLQRGRLADPGERGGVVLLTEGGSFDRSVISGGRLTGGGQGGGIASLDGPVTLARSTVSDNAGAGFSSVGGGMWTASIEGDDLLLITATTITGNTAFSGAALYTVTPGSFMATVTASTIAGGSGYSLLGGDGGRNVEVTGSIIDLGSVSLCGALASRGWNVFSASCWVPPAGLATDVVAPPGLGVLAANGGPTPTRLPTAGSAPIGFIPFGTAGLCDATTGPDQRGVARPVGPACDAGAVEQ